MDYELGIIGAGNMAEAIARGVMARGVFRADQIIAADVAPQRRELFESFGVRAVADNLDVAGAARVLLLSVKPQQMAAALAGMGTVMNDGAALVISIAAGIGAPFIEKHLGPGRRWRVIRTMPNTPMLVGEGMVAMAPGTHATRDDVATAGRIFEAAAAVVEVSEDKMDAVTALSGSGPAYVFFLVEQMIRAGVEMGLPTEQAALMARKTAFGAAKMLATSPDSPEELRRKVTSPGGTTHAAIEHMKSRDLPQTIVDAIKAAERRGRELASGQ
jgi:pyrroline-5-carboxylate reductase